MTVLKHYTAEEMAELFGISIHTFRSWLQEEGPRSPRGIKVGRKLYFSEDEVRRLYAARSEKKK